MNRTEILIYPDVCIVIALNALIICQPADEKEIIGNDVNYPTAYIVSAACQRRKSELLFQLEFNFVSGHCLYLPSLKLA